MKLQPRAYQQYCINRVINDPAVGLFLDMGLGKTVITLTAINELKYNRFQVHKVLVIAPKKVAESTWTAERDEWEHLKHLKINLVLGTAFQRKQALSIRGDIYVINRENIPWLVEYLGNQWDFDMVVIDEMSSFKSYKAKRFKALKSIRPRIKRVVGLTGTPRPNSGEDLWSQLYLLDEGERLENTITKFRARWMDSKQVNAAGLRSYTLKSGAEEMITSRISDICISMSAEDYLTLPDIIYHNIPVQLNAEAEKAYAEMEKKMLLEIENDTTISAPSAVALSNKLLQLCNGAVYDENHIMHEIHNCKIEALLETIESLNGSPALLFYSYQHDKNRILSALPKTLKIRELKTVDDQRAWNNREIDILLAHPASAAYGLNLQKGGNHVIWFGMCWSLELYLQANKRLHRSGQTEKVIIHHLITIGGRDEDVLDALNNKDTAQQSLLDSLKARIEKVKELV